MTDQTAPSTAADRRRRRRALLAGGLVLGLGAAGTLAAWTDSEFAWGQFNAGQFNVQGSEATTTAYNWADHYTSPGAQLAFSTGVTAMQPGQTYYAPFSLRVDPAAASYDADVVLQNSTSSGNDTLEAKLTWGARIVADPTQCTAAGYGAGTNVVADGTVMDYAGPGTQFRLLKDTVPKTVCFAVKLADQGTAAPNDPAWTFGTAPVTTVWQFQATAV